MRKIITLIIYIYFISITTAFASELSEILGLWFTEGAKSTVEVFECDSHLCGKIVSLKEPVYTDPEEGPLGQSKKDIHNPDPSKRQRPIVGLQLLEGLFAAGDGSWENGTIYDPESGNTYKCMVTLDGNNRLNVRGYIGISLIGRTTVWSR